MKRVKKNPLPRSLEQFSSDWTEEYKRSPAKLSKKEKDKFRRYYHKVDIKESLAGEAYNKCVYCESKIVATQFWHVEHILPFDKYRALAYEWTNLVLACQLCNNHKGNYDGPFVHPINDDPEIHIEYYSYFAKGKSHHGTRTIDVTNLNRAGLIERRIEEYKSLARLIQMYKVAPPGKLKDTAIEIIRDRVKNDREFSTALRQFAENVLKISL